MVAFITTTVKKLLKNNFQFFFYFFSHLRYRIFISLILSVLVGLMDGLGLAMFIPLLQMVDSSNVEARPEDMGNLSFIADVFQYLNIPLTLGVVLGVILFFFTLKGILKFFEGYVRVSNEQFFMKNIRFHNIKALSQYDYNKFVHADVGRIQNTFTAEVVKVNQGYRYYFMCLQYGVSVLVYIFLAFMANPQFAVLVVIGGALSGLIFTRLHKRTKKLSKKITVDSHSFQGLLIQKVAFFKYLKATGLMKRYADRLVETNINIEASQRKTGMINAAMAAVREPLIILVVVLVILIQVFYFSQSIGIIILSLLLFYRALTFLMGVQNFWNLFLGVTGSLLNMGKFINELRAGKEVTGKTIFPGFKEALQVRHLSMQYENKDILEDINLQIRKNETIALVGESGSGKTTLMNMMAGLLKPTSGEVLVDGVNLESIKKETFQQRLGYITQEAVIFNDTIFNNVTFWSEKNEENLKRFEAAVRKASIYDFVQLQPDKEDALLGNNGINLSGGQKQRLSIARELYKEVDFLFMDEATSALDSETERAIQENIEALKGQYSIIIIAHRLSTVKHADKIVLLNKGRIDQVGSFDELMQGSPAFKKMVELQGF